MEVKSASFVISNSHVDRCPQHDRPEYAFIGRSNVGKSSLINMLTGHKGLAMTSATPGKTLLINHFLINGDWYLADLPGYGYAKVSRAEKDRWSQLIEGYFAAGRDVRVVVLLVDSRHAPSADDLMMLDYLRETGLGTVIALTKIDKLNKTQRAERLAAFPRELDVDEDCLIPFSAVTGEGVDDLKELIDEVCASEPQ